MTDQTKESLGFAYIAKRPCGRLSAMAWDEPEYAKDTAKSVASWIRRGDVVERVERFKDQEIPLITCRRGEPCECRVKGKK